MSGALSGNMIHAILPNDADMFVGATPITLGSHAWPTVLQEFGHALGLQDPGDCKASDGDVTCADSRAFDVDTAQVPVVSCLDPGNVDPRANWTQNDGPQTPMICDILAIQAHCGVDTTTRLGSTA